MYSYDCGIPISSGKDVFLVWVRGDYFSFCLISLYITSALCLIEIVRIDIIAIFHISVLTNTNFNSLPICLIETRMSSHVLYLLLRGTFIITILLSFIMTICENFSSAYSVY